MIKQQNKHVNKPINKEQPKVHGNVINAKEESHEDLKKQAEEFKHSYLRALADYKNLEHRIHAERENMRDTIKRQVIEHFLPVLDNIHQAQVFTTDPGLKMVSNSFTQALKDLGVQEIELLGLEYDPHLAEVVEAIDGKQDNIIIEVLQKAYGMNGQVIRPGRVKVSKVKQS